MSSDKLTLDLAARVEELEELHKTETTIALRWWDERENLKIEVKRLQRALERNLHAEPYIHHIKQTGMDEDCPLCDALKEMP